jgi:hypothetical protein
MRCPMPDYRIMSWGGGFVVGYWADRKTFYIIAGPFPKKDAADRALAEVKHG